MTEAYKTNKIRGSRFIDEYLKGRVIDIGAGNDLVCPWAERFDIEDGDANCISKYRERLSYDAVHSSHCLEHMYSPPPGLGRLVVFGKTGGISCRSGAARGFL